MPLDPVSPQTQSPDLKHPGMIQVVSNDALLGKVLPEADCDEILLHICLAEMICRAWLLSGGVLPFSHREKFKGAWLNHAFPSDLVEILDGWCLGQSKQRCFDLPDGWKEDIHLKVRGQVQHMLKFWQESDGMVLFVVDETDLSPATALPFKIEENRLDGSISLDESLEVALNIAIKSKWTTEHWRPRVIFPSLNGPCPLPMRGKSACLPFLAALRFRSKGVRMPPLHTAFSGALTTAGELEPPVVEALWDAKRNLISQIGARCILPGDWPVNEPVQGALNELMGEVWDDYLEAVRIPIPVRSNAWPCDFTALIESKQRGFSGSCLQIGDSHTLVVAPQGTGKSALMAKLVADTHKRQILAHHFCQAEIADSRHALTFVRSVAAMLARRLPGYDDCLADDSVRKALDGGEAATALVQGIITPLSKLQPPKDGVRYIVVDGLDESIEGGKSEITDLLARYCNQLPDWLKLLATTRSVDLGGISKLRTWARIDLKSDENICLYIKENLPDADEALVRRLADKCSGNFLYTSLLIDDLQKGRRGLTEEEIAMLPTSLEGYYADTFDRVFTSGYDDQSRCIFEILLAAREPLKIQDLQSAAGMESMTKRDFHSLLKKCDQMLVPDWKCIERVTFHHHSLARWLDADTDASPEEGCAPAGFRTSSKQGHKKLAAWCGKDGHDFENLPDYSRKHGTHHFIAVGDWTSVHGRLAELKNIECRARHGELAALLEEYDSALALTKMPAADQQTIQAFKEFVASQPSVLGRFAKLPGFVAQQALNHRPTGPVHEAAAELMRETKLPALRRRWAESEKALDAADDTISIPVIGRLLDYAVDPQWKRIATLHKDDTETTTIRFWNPATGQKTDEWTMPHAATTIHLLEDDQVLSIDQEGNIVKHDLRAETKTKCRTPHAFDAHAVTPDGRKMVMVKLGNSTRGEHGYDEWPVKMWRWDWNSNETTQVIEYVESTDMSLPSKTIQISADGRLALYENQLFDLEAGKEKFCIRAECGSLLSMDGKKIIKADHTHIEHWQTEPEAHHLRTALSCEQDDQIHQLLATSPCGNLVCLERQNSSWGIWSSGSDEPLKHFGGKRVEKICFNHDGSRTLVWLRSSAADELKILSLDRQDEGLAASRPTPSSPYSPITSGMSLDGRQAFSGQSIWCQNQGWLATWDVEHASSKPVDVDMSRLDGGCMAPNAEWLFFHISLEAKGREIIKINLDGSEEQKFRLPELFLYQLGPLHPMADPRRVRMSVIRRPHVPFDVLVGRSRLSLKDELRVEEIGSWVFHCFSRDKELIPEDWSVLWNGERIPFWGGGGFRRLLALPNHTAKPNEIVSSDGRWALCWELNQLSIHRLEDNGQTNAPEMVFTMPDTIKNVSVDSRMTVLAIDSPPGELTFFDLCHFEECAPLVAGACRSMGGNSVPGPPTVWPTCCAQEFKLSPELANTIEDLSRIQAFASFDDPRLRTKCSHCGSDLKFNPFFIDIRESREWK